MEKSKVVVIKCDTYDADLIYNKLKSGLDMLGGMGRFVKSGEKILLKPNIISGRNPDAGATTHPTVFEAAIRLLQDVGAVVSFGDSPGIDNPAYAAKKSGFKDVADKYGVTFGDFGNATMINNEKGVVGKQFYICNGVLDADGIISLSKMKSHQLTRLTGAVKNQFGTIQGVNKAAYHAKLPNARNFCTMLIDLNKYLKPRLFIMDGILAMEGNGPSNGTPIKMNVLLMSTDPVAIDATFCKLVDLDPTYMPTNIYGKMYGLGTYLDDEIELLGDDIEPLKNPNFDCVRMPVKEHMMLKQLLFVESLVTRKPYVDKKLCVGCGVCVNACPVHGITFDKNKKPKYNYKKCIKCFCCQEVCHHKAIKVTNPLFFKFFK